MQTIFYSILAFLCVSASAMATTKTSTDVNDALRGLAVHPDGVIHIADDGVARSYDGEGNVIDGVRLSNAQLSQYLANAPAAYADAMDHLHEVFDHVDGHDVTDENLIFHPPASLRPALPFVAKTETSLRSANPEAEVKAALEERQPMFCAGQPCTTSAACLFLGCSGCITIDETFLGAGGGLCAR